MCCKTRLARFTRGALACQLRQPGTDGAAHAAEYCGCYTDWNHIDIRQDGATEMPTRSHYTDFLHCTGFSAAICQRNNGYVDAWGHPAIRLDGCSGGLSESYNLLRSNPHQAIRGTARERCLKKRRARVADRRLASFTRRIPIASGGARPRADTRNPAEIAICAAAPHRKLDICPRLSVRIRSRSHRRNGISGECFRRPIDMMLTYIARHIDNRDKICIGQEYLLTLCLLQVSWRNQNRLPRGEGSSAFKYVLTDMRVRGYHC
jgi:hypothetical protein